MDDLDDDLRRLFSDDRLDVHVAPDVTDSVVRGATRRRRRRTAVAGAFGVVALAGVGLGLTELHLPTPDELAGPLLPTASSTSTTTPPVSVSTFTSTATVTVNPPPNSNGGNPGTNPNPGNTGKKSTSNPPPPATPEAQPGRYGSLALGMPEAEALATGSLVEPSSPADPEGRCKAYATKSVPDTNAVIISPAKGIVRITLASYAKTPKNVGAGSTVDAVKAAYANATQSGSDVIVPMAATPKWSYVFENDGATVTTVRMRLADNDCTTV
ncbi:hypothetical protein SK803_18420 [Lentzea sp. BCCO 10_0856]|uniref:Uncharacterized protein n=1 Tax=Lentzea miocenica TaxID=3095431 RepID=A0ABU4T2K8_9PSEU|nr:hypothetical protein [Lentzea sp. BCCO 10_0856]MDX8032198.1 hypothetical protein [Lentzea sp. BCCO 10_0856]